MKLKLDDQGRPVQANGLPVYTKDDGQEVAVDVAKLFSDLHRVNTESAGRRKELETLQGTLKGFEGLDPAAAREALQKLEAIGQKKLIDAGEVDKVKAQIEAGFTAKLTKAEQALAAKEATIRHLAVSQAFAGSKFLRESTVLTPSVAQAALGPQFTVETGPTGAPVVVAKDLNGNPIMSPGNPAQYATTEEALQHLVHQHPERDALLRAGRPGGGTPPNGRPAGAGGKGWSQLSRAEQNAIISEQGADAARTLIAAEHAPTKQ